MNRLYQVSLVACLYLAVVSASAEQPVRIHNGFGSADAFLKMSRKEKSAYAMGAVNGMLVAPLLGASEDDSSWVGSCVEGMNNEQVAAIIEKHIRAHPERWHYGLHVESWMALKEACQQ
jgi:hypothetical protein